MSKKKDCRYNYHDDLHPEVCMFETILDHYLMPDHQLTLDAIKYRKRLIAGVNRMCQKVENFKTTEKWRWRRSG